MLRTIQTDQAPKAIGPYSQAVAVGQFLYTSGQIPLDPQTQTIAGTTIQEQTKQVLANLDAVLAAAGTSWAQVVKTTVFMTDLTEFAEMNAIYEAHLGTAKPARSTVQVAALPRNVKIEIELVAFRQN